MFAAIRAFFQMFTTLFMAGNHGATAILNLSIIGDEMSATYLDKTRHDRKVQAKALGIELENTKVIVD